MPHGDRNLTVAALETLHACERGTLEILLKCRRYRIGLFRGQKSKMKLLFIVDKVTRLCLDGIGTLKRAGKHGHRKYNCCIHADYYTHSAAKPKPSLKDNLSGASQVFHPCILRLETTRTTDKNNFSFRRETSRRS